MSRWASVRWRAAVRVAKVAQVLPAYHINKRNRLRNAVLWLAARILP